jgi:hypothetical protein
MRLFVFLRFADTKTPLNERRLGNWLAHDDNTAPNQINRLRER